MRLSDTGPRISLEELILSNIKKKLEGLPEEEQKVILLAAAKKIKGGQ